MAVVGTGRRDALVQQPLGRAVGVRDHVGGAALRLHPARGPAEAIEQKRAGVTGGGNRELEQAVGRHAASVLNTGREPARPARNCPEILDIFPSLMHSARRMGTFIHHMRERRRQRKLARELELRFRERVDAATAAAARLAEDLHQE